MGTWSRPKCALTWSQAASVTTGGFASIADEDIRHRIRLFYPNRVLTLNVRWDEATPRQTAERETEKELRALKGARDEYVTSDIPETLKLPAGAVRGKNSRPFRAR
jgi:hypothetical protein